MTDVDRLAALERAGHTHECAARQVWGDGGPCPGCPGVFRVVVTGGRHFTDKAAVWGALDRLLAKHGSLHVAHGACKSGTVTYRGSEGSYDGADGLAHGWAVEHGQVADPHPADWSRGPAGGPIRNRAMLDAVRPGGVVAFPGGRGTADCCRAAEERKIAVWRPGSR